MTATGTAGFKRKADRSGWEPPPFVTSPGLSIEIDKEACTGCDLCILSCPTDCLELDTEVMVAYILRLDTCIICHNCELVCKPDCLHIYLDPTEGKTL